MPHADERHVTFYCSANSLVFKSMKSRCTGSWIVKKLRDGDGGQNERGTGVGFVAGCCGHCNEPSR